METSVAEGRKSKKMKMELLEGWGLRTGPLEDKSSLGEETITPSSMWDWNDNLGNMRMEKKEGRQAKITTWAGVKETVLLDGESIPDGRKEEGEEIDQTENIPEGSIYGEREEVEVPDGSLERRGEEVIKKDTEEIKRKKPVKSPARRVRGKLSKKEIKDMKNKHKSIASMMAPPPTKEATKFEKKADLEIGEVERVDEEREERLKRLP